MVSIKKKKTWKLTFLGGNKKRQRKVVNLRLNQWVIKQSGGEKKTQKTRSMLQGKRKSKTAVRQLLTTYTVCVVKSIGSWKR